VCIIPDALPLFYGGPEIGRRNARGCRRREVNKGFTRIRRYLKQGLGQSLLLVALPDVLVFGLLHELMPGTVCTVITGSSGSHAISSYIP
jgi:hypothetical protein